MTDDSKLVLTLIVNSFYTIQIDSINIMCHCQYIQNLSSHVIRPFIWDENKESLVIFVLNCYIHN